MDGKRIGEILDQYMDEARKSAEIRKMKEGENAEI